MKRKYLSALLMGVLTLSSVSTFTSCKDYDDDISNLQGQIDKLATADQLSKKVAELQALISSNKSDITSLQSELAKKTTLDEVKAVLADYATKQYVNDADKTLQDAIDALKTGDIAKLKEDVLKAQATADKAAEDAKKANTEIVETLKTLATKTELKDAADAAQKAIEALESKNAEALKKAQDAINETLKSYATKSDVEDGDKKTLESLASTVKNASDALALANTNKQAIADALKLLGEGYSAENTVAAAIEAIKGQIGTPNKELGTLDSRLAAIESVLNGVKDDDTKLGLATKVTNIENKLKDIIGEYTTMVTEVSLVGSFVNNQKFNTNTAADGISLKYTWGYVKDNFTFGKAEKDDEDNQVPAAENQQTFVKGTTFSNKNEIVVRVNPTNAVLTKASIKLVDSQGNSLDDVLEIGEPKQFTTLLTKAASNTGLWTIPVTVKDGVAKDNVGKWSKGSQILYAVAVQNTKNAEDRYVASTYDIAVDNATDFEPAKNLNDVEIQSVNTMANAVKLGTLKKTASDNGNVIPAKSGEDIKISFKNLAGKIKYFYVVRDDSHPDANTSGSSAINAWKSYKYDGTAYGKVVEVNPSDPTGTINVTINGQVGDEIGFRIFAVNYNGTLTPLPNKENKVGGQSFVVYVGENENQASVKGDLVAVSPDNNETDWLPLTGKLKDGVAINGTFEKDGIQFATEFAKDAKGTHASKNSEIKYVKFKTTSTITSWKDDATISYTIIQKDADNKMVQNQIAVSLTKKLPTAETTKALYGYTWKDAQLVNGKYTAYVTPETGWTTADATQGYQKFTQAITGLKTGFEIKVEGVKKKNGKYTEPDTYNTDDWKVTVDKALIDGTTEHKTTISYNYGQVSSETEKDVNGVYADYVVPVETIQTVFACPLTQKDQSYAWDQYKSGEDAKGNDIMSDLNYLTYGNENTVASKKLLDYIKGTNKYNNNIFGGTLRELLPGGSKAKYVSLEDVKLISAQSGKEDYFKAKFENGEITFEANSEASNPVEDVKSWLVIKLKDAFGCDQTYKLPFTVKRAK